MESTNDNPQILGKVAVVTLLPKQHGSYSRSTCIMSDNVGNLEILQGDMHRWYANLMV